MRDGRVTISHLSRLAKIQKIDIITCRDCGETATLRDLSGFCQYLTLDTFLSFGPEIPFLWIHPKDTLAKVIKRHKYAQAYPL